MKIGRSVTKAIDEWESGDVDSAMLHACNAVDGTARKQPFGSQGNRARFVRLLRENYDILGPMGMPGVDVVKTLFPVAIKPGEPVKAFDLADVVYLVHRCTHGHGDDLPGGFELLRDAHRKEPLTELIVEPDHVRLSDRIIFGLLGVAVANPMNAGERASDGYYLSYNQTERMTINEWWGRREAMVAVMGKVQMPLVHLNFGNWLPA